MKYCTKCGLEKESFSFAKRKAKRDGLCSWCKQCTNEASKSKKASRRVKDRSWFLWQKAKYRAEKQCVPFTIQQADVVIPDYCPELGIEMKKSSGPLCDSSPTLDKITPSLGYVPGNVVVVSFKANSMKRNATVNELGAVANFYSRLINGTPKCSSNNHSPPL